MPFADDELIAWLPKLRRFTSAVTRNVEFDEVYATTLLRLLERRQQVHDAAELYTIVRNTSITIHRKWGRLIPTDPSTMMGIADPTTDLEGWIFYEQVCEQIDKLEVYHREVIELAAAGLSYNEIAEKLKIPKGTVRSRLCRARVALRKRLEL